MAKRIKSGLKHRRKSARHAAANASVKSRIKTLVRGAGTGPDAIRAAQAALDKAAARGVVHPNAAARRKSRMMRSATPGPA